jgi:hypothetical protein
MGQSKRIIHWENWQQRAHKTKKNTTQYVFDINLCTNNVNKICALIQTTGDKDEPNIVLIVGALVQG